MDDTHDPKQLYDASLERIEEAAYLFESGHYGMSMYISGVAVETILQALALRNGASHDAKHDLSAWLHKCPSSMVDAVKRSAGWQWSQLCSLWRNDLRYLSYSGLLARLREKWDWNLKGDNNAKVKECARRCFKSADTVLKKGIKVWSSYPK